MNRKELINELLKLSLQFNKKEILKSNGYHYIAEYKQECKSHTQSDISALNTAINTINVDQLFIKDRCTSILIKILEQEPNIPLSNLTHILDRGVLNKNEIKEGYLPLINDLPANILRNLLSKENPDIKILVLKGNNVGKILPISDSILKELI